MNDFREVSCTDILKSKSEDIRLTNGNKWMVWSEDRWEVYILPKRCRIPKLITRCSSESKAILELIK